MSNHKIPDDTRREIETRNESDYLASCMHIGRPDDRVKPEHFLHPFHQCVARAIIAASPTPGVAPEYTPLRLLIFKDRTALSLLGGDGQLEAALMEIFDLHRSEIVGTQGQQEDLAKAVLTASINRRMTSAIQRLESAHSSGEGKERILSEIRELDEAVLALTSDPIPVAGEVLPPHFPIQTIPGALRPFALECSRITGVPVEMAAMCCFAVASAATASRLRVKSVNGKTTTANIMVLIGAESGTGKSETFRECMAPFEKCAEEEKRVWRAQILPNAKAEIRLLTQEIKRLENSLKKGSGDRDNIKSELAEKERLLTTAELLAKQPVYHGSDFTTAELIRVLCRMGGQMFAASPDAKNFVDMVLGRYNEGGTDEEVYLKGFSLESIDRHRVSDGSQDTPEACIVGLWLTQPDKLERLLGERALSEGGLLPRILMMLIHCRPFRVKMDEHGISEETRGAYNSVITELFQAFRNQQIVFEIEADLDARQALVDFHNSLADRREYGKDLSDVTSFAARWGEYAWRLSLICHAVRHGEFAGDSKLCLEDAQSGIAITEWASAQQLDVLNVGRARVKRQKHEQVLKLVRAQGQVVARDIYQANITPRKQVDLATALLQEMVALKLLRSFEKKSERKNHIQTIYTLF